MSAATWGLLVSVFLASAVEAVEAATIVLAMGLTRGWRSALTGVGVALAALAAVTAAFGYALVRWVPESGLQLFVGALLLIFGLQWLRKAILRSSGRKAVHDEDEIFRDQTDVASGAAPRSPGSFDSFGFLISLKGTFLEGVEVVFIVVTFGVNAHDVPVAVVGAAAGVVTVVVVAAALRRPLSMVPENLLKYVVGLLLASFGTFWAVEGLGLLRSGQESVAWPGGDAAILVLLVGWWLLSRAFVVRLRRSGAPSPAGPPSAPVGGPSR